MINKRRQVVIARRKRVNEGGQRNLTHGEKVGMINKRREE